MIFTSLKRSIAMADKTYFARYKTQIMAQIDQFSRRTVTVGIFLEPMKML